MTRRFENTFNRLQGFSEEDAARLRALRIAAGLTPAAINVGTVDGSTTYWDQSALIWAENTAFKWIDPTHLLLDNGIGINWADSSDVSVELLILESIGIPTAPGDACVVANFEGTDGDRVYTGDDGRVWTFRGSTAINDISNAQVKFGSTSYDFGGQGAQDDAITTDITTEYNAGDFVMGTRDWYIRFWVYNDSSQVGGHDYGCIGDLTGTRRGIRWSNNNNTVSMAYDGTGGGGENNFPTFGAAPTDGTWHEFVFERFGNGIFFYLDGVQQGSTFDCTGDTIAGGLIAATKVLVIGSSIQNAVTGITPVPNSYTDAFDMCVGVSLNSGVAPGVPSASPPVGFVEKFTVGDPAYVTELDGLLIGLKNDVGINWDNVAGEDIEHLIFTPVGVTTPGGADVEVYWSFDGADTDTAFTGEIPVTALTFVGATSELTSDQVQFGPTSFSIGGINDGSAFAHSNNLIDLSNFDVGDFTLEFWYYAEAVSLTGGNIFLGQNNDLDSGTNWRFGINGNIVVFQYNVGGGQSSNENTFRSFGGASHVADTWTHLVIERVSGVITCYRQGVVLGATVADASFIFSGGTGDINVLSAGNFGNIGDFTYIDDVRIQIGSARYNGAFTPPVAPGLPTTAVETFIAGDPGYPTEIDGSSLSIAGAYTVPVLDGTIGQVLTTDGAGVVSFAAIPAQDHGALLGLADDDHLQYLLLAGRAGGQGAFGGLNAGDILTLYGSASSPDVGRIHFGSPLEILYDTFSNTTPVEQYAVTWAPTVPATGNYIGGFLNTSAIFNISTALFIPAIFSDGNIYNVGLAPGFSAITFINELSQVVNDGNFNLPSALVMNIGLQHHRETSGTSTTAGTTGMNFSPSTRASVSGAVMTKTDQTAIRCSPVWSTVGGSTANLGTIRGLHCFNPAVGIFQPGGGAEAMTAYIGLDMNNISFGGNVVKAAVRSAQTASGTNAWFLLNNGNAHSDHGAGHIYFDDNAGLALGGISNSSFDYWCTWNGAGNYYRQFFFLNSSSLRWSNPDPNRFLFDSDGGSVDGEYNFNCAKATIGAQTGAIGNGWFQFIAPIRATSINGDWSDILITAAGNLTVGHTMGTVASQVFNAPSLTNGGGTIVTHAAVQIGGNPSGVPATNRVGLHILSNPTGAATINAALWVENGPSIFGNDIDITGDIIVSGLVDGVDVAAHAADTDIHWSDAPNDGLNYVRNSLAWSVLPPAVTGLGQWRYRTETGTPPASGQVRFDNADVSLATEFYLHETNDGGSDASNFLDLLAVAGNVMYIQNSVDADSYVVIELGTFVDNGVYRTYQIANLLEGSGGEPAQNRLVTVVAVGAGGGGAAPASTLPPLAARLLFDDDVTGTDPDVTGIKFNSITLTSVSLMRFSKTDLDAVTVADLFQYSAAGDRLRIFSEDDANHYYDFALTGVPSDQTDHWLLGVDFIAGNATVPTEGDELVVQFMPVAYVNAGQTDTNQHSILFWEDDHWKSTDVIQVNPSTPPIGGRIRAPGSSNIDPSRAFLFHNVGNSTGGLLWSEHSIGGNGFFVYNDFNGSPVRQDHGVEISAVQHLYYSLHDDGSMNFGTAGTVGTLWQEKSAQHAFKANFGEFWVRDDAPCVPMFTDDTGADFNLLTAAGGALPVGTVIHAGLKWDTGGAAWIEETQIALIGGSTGIQAFDATLANYVSMGHDGVTGGFSCDAATTEVIFGQGGGPITAWRFQEMVRVPDGLLTQMGISFFGDIGTGFYRHALGLSMAITGVEQLRVSNANHHVYSDTFHLNPNALSDDVSMQVNPAGDPDDFVLTGISLVDMHIRGFTGRVDIDSGFEVINNIIDLNNSGAATASTIINRNSAGGVTLNVNATTGHAQLGQTSGAGAAEDVWIHMTRNGQVEIGHNNFTKLATAAGGVDVIGSMRAFESTVAESIDLFCTLTQANIDIAAGSNLVIRNGTEHFIFGTANGAVSLYYNGILKSQSADNTIAGRLTGHRTTAHDLSFQDVGLALSAPQVNPTGFTLGGDAALETTVKANTTAFTITCEGSGTNNFPVGATHPFWNRGASGDITIADGGETLIYLDGSSATDVGASMTCGPGGAGEIYRESTTVYLVTGTGLTA